MRYKVWFKNSFGELISMVVSKHVLERIGPGYFAKVEAA